MTTFKMRRPLKLRLKMNMFYLYFIIVCLLGTFIYIMICNKLLELRWRMEPVVIHWVPPENNISCHRSVEGDGLLSTEDPSFLPGPKSIFFHETSCRGGIDSRQACSVESAARANPDWQVYLLFNSPVSHNMLKVSCLAKLLQFANVNVARVHPSTYSKGYLVHSTVNKKLKFSLHPIEHTADIMKLLTLNKWGGVCLDLDEVVVRPFDSLPPNWIAKASYEELSTGAMGFSKDGIGKNLTSAVLNEIYETYDPRGSSYNGPLAINRVLNRICPDAITKMDPYCKGVTILSHKTFHPIHYSWAFVYFQESEAFKMNAPYAYHLWNMITKVYRVTAPSLYTKIAEKYCPTIYKMYGEDFGV